MRKLKGLWLIGIGLFMLTAWIAVFVYAAYILYGYGTPPPFPIILAHAVFIAFCDLVYPNLFSVYNLWPITGFALTCIGLYRLVRSLLQSRS